MAVWLNVAACPCPSFDLFLVATIDDVSVLPRGYGKIVSASVDALRMAREKGGWGCLSKQEHTPWIPRKEERERKETR